MRERSSARGLRATQQQHRQQRRDGGLETQLLVEHLAIPGDAATVRRVHHAHHTGSLQIVQRRLHLCSANDMTGSRDVLWLHAVTSAFSVSGY